MKTEKPLGSFEEEKYIDKSVKEYLTDLAAKKPAPGGGSAAALLGATAAALVSMVCNYTVGKEKFKSVENELQEILAKSEGLRAKFQMLVDLDIESYSRVSEVSKLPKGPERGVAIKAALLKSLDVSAEIARRSFNGIKFCPPLAEKANPYLISDVKCAAWGFHAAFKCALVNIDINLTTLKNPVLIAKTKEEFRPLEEEIQRLVDKITG